MESSIALGRLELSPGPAAGGVTGASRVSGVESAHDRGAQRHQSPAHLNGCVPLSHQVAGHKYGVDKVGILQHPDGTVLKQLQPPPRGPREMHFYSMVYADDCCDPCLLELRNYLPKYYGTWASPDNPSDLYLKLEDVTRLFHKPCIMDVKLGQRSYDPFASQEKREQQIRKYPLMEEIGFLLLGMRVYNVSSDSFDSYDQHYGRKLLKDTLKEGLAKFFFNGVALRKDAVSTSIAKVQQILRWFESQQQLCFYASSLLFVYEGQPPSAPPHNPLQDKTPAPDEARKDEHTAEYNNNNIQEPMSWDYSLDTICTNHKSLCQRQCKEKQPNHNQEAAGQEVVRTGRAEPGAGPTVEVRMIDFAHVFPSDAHDQGYIYGLKHLLSVLQQLLHEPERH
ncbi:inositol polyphosphate multikinase [Boleophthalmus pectinirostris]|uniref:inositol polyphosphate multikinase n=1 Tax=Boleophthalmus pectinirostris TaxID=150288 RepID=UPI000A1C3D63|nr:inositol polyphosphate multikinase [Boleophthalmus pectinirostris]XP_020773839.1 inositol polyphosphate multikinase [Boleophthalmus pectinirostris]